MDKRPIGVFDSGIGGLTVVREIINTLPYESLIYLGDTARVPYGTRGGEIITQFATELTRHLLTQNVKAIVVACNTISATCLPQIRKIATVPVIGVIKPTVSEVLNKNHRNIGVIGTRATIASRIYEKEIKAVNSRCTITSSACPLFVPLAEEGMGNGQAALLIAKQYLQPLVSNNVESIILGCTHYPLLKPIIQKVVGKEVDLIDSAVPTAKILKALLYKKRLYAPDRQKPTYTFFVTDDPEKAKSAAGSFLGHTIPFTLKKAILNN